ncbi:cytochrome P450 [Geopyxis carbonaria]|nr:cytochrome P450 [Geopyxis carbonaria]
MWLHIIIIAIASYVFYNVFSAMMRSHGPNAVSIDSFLLLRKYFLNAPDVLLESYKKHREKPFFFTTLRQRHQVIVTSDALVSEISTAPQSVLSTGAWVKHIIQADYTIPGHYIGNDLPPSKVPNFRYLNVSLTRNIANFIPGLQEEVVNAIENIKTKASSETLTIDLYELAQDLVVRSSLRVLVGQPLCYDSEFIEAMKVYLTALPKCGFILGLLPRPLKWLVLQFTSLPKAQAILEKKLRALAAEITVKIQAEIETLGVNEASKQWDEYGDLFTELIRASLTRQKFNIQDCIIQVLGTGFAAQHTTVYTITATLAELSVHPEYHADLRAEISASVAEHGWTQAGFASMSKLDSFVMESMRHRPLNAVTMNRIALSEFKFSDGTTVYPGDHVAAIAEPRFRNVDDEKHEFRGFQHHELRQQSSSAPRFTSIDDLAWPLFGRGNHPCPGRFWAELLLKLVVSNLLESFDFPEGVNDRPARFTFEENALPMSGSKLTLNLRKKV